MTKYVILFGGVGNRLFQLARAIDLKSNGHQVIVVQLEDCWLLSVVCYRFLGWTKHPMWLDLTLLCYNLDVRICTRDFLVKLKIYLGILFEIFIKRAENFNSNLMDDNRRTHVGYFQGKNSVTTESISEISVSLSRMLNLKQKEAREIIHIRAGDFSDNDRILGVLVSEFHRNYQNCIAVTDDADYVQKTYPELQMFKGSTPLNDFKLLSTASLILPSDSTFCFWACAIAKNIFDAKISIVPKSSIWHHLDDRKELSQITS